MPTPAHTKDDFALIVEGVFGLFFTLLFLWPLTRMMKCLTEDKEARINEMMKMMGLPAEAGLHAFSKVAACTSCVAIAWSAFGGRNALRSVCAAASSRSRSF